MIMLSCFTIAFFGVYLFCNYLMYWCVALNCLAKNDDKVVEQAYANGKMKLINVAVGYAKNDNFYSAEKSIEILEKLEAQQKGR